MNVNFNLFSLSSYWMNIKLISTLSSIASINSHGVTDQEHIRITKNRTKQEEEVKEPLLISLISFSLILDVVRALPQLGRIYSRE